MSSYTVSVTASINTPKSFDDFIILISFISSFEINEANPFPALTAPFPLIFRSYLFIALGIELLTNPVKLSPAKGIAIFVSDLFPKLPNQEPKDPPH